MDNKSKVLAKIAELYPPGTRYKSAFIKRFPKDYFSDPDRYITYGEIKSQPFESFTHEAYKRTGFAVNQGYSALIYCDDEWADIVDEHDNIIKVIDDPFSEKELTQIRNWLYKD